MGIGLGKKAQVQSGKTVDDCSPLGILTAPSNAVKASQKAGRFLLSTNHFLCPVNSVGVFIGRILPPDLSFWGLWDLPNQQLGGTVHTPGTELCLIS